MNYVAHGLSARGRSPEFRFGAMTPDFTGMYGLGLKRIKSNEDRVFLSPTELDVQEGIDFHFRTDVVFGHQALFSLLKRKFRDEVAVDFFHKDSHLIRLLGDIGTELLLDGYVMERWPESVELYHEAVASVAFRNSFALGVATSSPDAMLEKINTKRGILPDYGDPISVAKIIAMRVSGRKRLAFGDISMPNVIRSLAAHQPNVWEYGEALFLETQTSVSSKTS